MTDLDDILRGPVSRRAFLTRMTAAGLGAAAATLLAGCGGSGGNTPAINNGGNNNGGGPTFADPTNFPGIQGRSENEVVLNYALTLETLEADLYRQALNLAAGKPVATPLPASASGYTLAVSDGGLGALAPVGFLYLQQYAYVEAAHRDFLRAAIPSVGGTPVGPNPKGYTTGLSAGADLKAILGVILAAEETGVTAYLGAAGFLTDPTLVQIASSIYTTEARHSAGVNYVLGNDIGPSGKFGGAQPHSDKAANEFEYAQTPAQVLNAVKPFLL